MFPRILACLSVIALTSCLGRPPSHPTTLRVMTWNIHHGRGLDGKVDLRRIAQVIRESNADIVALQEVDVGTERTQGRDLASELAQLCGMTRVFGKNIDFEGGDYGNAVLSKFAVRASHNLHYKMIRKGEQRGLLRVTLGLDDAVAGSEIQLWNTHIDYRRDDSERLSNLGEIHEIVAAEKPMPIVLCGDFNADPGTATHAAALLDFRDCFAEVGTGQGLTFRSHEPTKRIDYVFLRRDEDRRSALQLVPIRAWVPETQASDHSPLVVEFRVEF